MKRMHQFKRFNLTFFATAIILFIFNFAPAQAQAHNFTLRARSTDGQGHVNLIIDNQVVANWILGASMNNYTANNIDRNGDIKVEFDNDAADRDIQVDYLVVDNETRQAEDQAVNTGVWQNNDCGGSYSEWLHCWGEIEFGATGGGASCSPTSIIPYMQIAGGSWEQISSTIIQSGDQVRLGPQPVHGGSWSWSGCGTSGSSREQSIYPTSSCTATATYTNACGAQSTRNFTIAVFAEADGTIYDGSDFEQLKWNIGTDTLFQEILATVADALGFAWCGGTASELVGEDMVASMDLEGNISIEAAYRPDDPYADGYRADERLEIYLSNWRYRIDPSKIDFGEPEISKIENIIRGEVSLVNFDSQNPASLEQWLDYEHVYTKSHAVHTNLTTGTRLQSEIKVSSAPFGLGYETSYQFEFTFSAENGWEDQSATTEALLSRQIVKTTVPPNSQKRIFALCTEATSKLPYATIANLAFDITFKGFLRYGGNARVDHPTDRPTVSVTFGTESLSGWEHILDQYEHRNITGYSQWDWNWAMENQLNLGWALSRRADAIVALTGTFTGARDVETRFVASDSESVGTDTVYTPVILLGFPAIRVTNSDDPTVVGESTTLQVGEDGSKDYTTIEAAFNALPDSGGLIEVYPGTYDEKLMFDKNNVILMGMGSDASQVVITHNDSQSKINPDTGEPYGTTGSATVTVTGKDFYATNLTIRNTADFEPPNYQDNAQAVALLTKGDRAVYRACRFLGGQDTLYVNNNKRAYFNNCYIEGNCDFIFGYGKAVFDDCIVKAKIHHDLISEVTITAQARQSSSDDNGFVFNNTDILFDDIYMNNVWLGRPWKPYSTVYFLNTQIHQNGEQVKDEGWIEWIPEEYNPGQGTNYLPTSTYREYNTYVSNGNGGWTEFDYSKRESISPNSNTELSDSEAQALAADTYLANDDGWTPTAVSYGDKTNQSIKVEQPPYGVPGEPTIYEVTVGNQNLELYFAGKGANPQTTGYRMWAVQNGTTYYASSEDLPPTTMRYFVNGLTNGVPARIYVAGINSVGEGPAAESNWFTPVSDAPSVPADITFTDNGDNSVTMTFTIPDEGSQPVFGPDRVEHAGVYTALYASKEDAFMGNEIEGTSQGFTSTSYTFYNLQSNTTYWVSLWVYNGKRSPTLITKFTSNY